MRRQSRLSKIISLLILIIVSTSYSQYARVMKFKMDNRNLKKFGYDCPESDEGIGPVSIALHGDEVYVVDNHQDNIKKIDLVSGRIVAVTGTGGTRYKRWFRDVAVLNGKIVVTSDLNMMYVFNPNLTQIDSFFVEGAPKYRQEGTKFLIWVSDTLYAYNIFQDTFYQVYSIGEKVKLGSPGKHYYSNDFLLNSAHGRGYTVELQGDSLVFQNNYVALRLDNVLPSIRCFDAINVDYDNKRMVCFDVSRLEFSLYIYDYPKTTRK
jgi:DNA-binding beta-propeller fold protein YncE